MPRPSFDLKLDRAEKHLIDLHAVINAYVNSHPYEIRVSIEGKKQRRIGRLHFTAQPSDDVALIVADFFYNVRSALDHLAGALVPSSARRSVMYPVMFQGVWDPPVDGENNERSKQRQRWITYTRTMKPEAVALLKRTQPPDPTVDDDDPLFALSILNRISNADRHTRLPILSHTLAEPTFTGYTADGVAHRLNNSLGDMEGLKDLTPITFPDGIVNMEVQGTALVLLDVGNPGGGVWLPGPLNTVVTYTRQVFDAFRPYLHH